MNRNKAVIVLSNLNEILYSIDPISEDRVVCDAFIIVRNAISEAIKTISDEQKNLGE